MKRSPLLAPFAGRKGGPGVAYLLREGMLAIPDAGSARLGVDEQAMSAQFVITSNDPDRVGDVIEPRGIDLTNFRKSPIAFFNHQEWPLPIGKWEDPAGNLTLVLEQDRVTGTLYFSQRSAEALQVFVLVAEDILRCTSVGFNPIQSPVRRGDDEPSPWSLHRGFYFPAVELLEVSVVGVPCNPSCTVVRRYLADGKIAGEPISPRLRKSLEPLSQPSPAWAQGATLLPPTDETMKNKKPTAKRVKLQKLMDEAAKRGRKRKKEMGGTSGTEGGYTEGQGPSAEDTKRIKDEITAVAEKHKEGDPDYHRFFFHAAKGDVFHVCGDACTPEHVRAVKEGLYAIDGVKSVTQDAESGPKDEDGYEKVYPKEAGDEEAAGDGPGATQMTAGEGAGDEAAKSVKKDAADAPPTGTGPSDNEGAAEEENEVAEGDASVLPHGAQCAQALVGFLEGEVAVAEPEVVGFLQELLDQVRDWAEERYPDQQFGGEADKETQDEEAQTDAQEQEESEEVLSQYRAARARRVKRMSKKALAIVREAADHLGDMASMDAGEEFTRTHKAACKMHARELDMLHCAMSDGRDEGAAIGEERAPKQAARDDASILLALAKAQEGAGRVEKIYERVTGRPAA